MKEKIRAILLDTLKEIGEELEIDRFETIDDNTAIYDNLDSMALLDLILEIEDSLQKEFGRYIQIADEKSMDRELTPLKSVESAVDMILSKVENG